MTVFEQLQELDKFIRDQIDIETGRPSYVGTQRAFAYKRVQQRLRSILRAAKKVRGAFHFEEPGPQEAGAAGMLEIEGPGRRPGPSI